MRRSVERGKGKWITGYPDLHSGIDALSAIRRSDRLSMDLLLNPEPVRRAMRQMTQLFKDVVDETSRIILPAGQGTSNWTMGWSAQKFLCIGQNDFSCMIGPEMFREFLLDDTLETTHYVERSLYHLDGPNATQHLLTLCEIERLNGIQWVPGDGYLGAARWIPLMRKIQAAGKLLTMCPATAEDALICCRELDIRSLYLWVFDLKTSEEAEGLFKEIKKICAARREPHVST